MDRTYVGSGITNSWCAFPVETAARKGFMSETKKIEEVKREVRGIINPKYRTTSRDSEGKIGVSDWRETTEKAVQESRERLSPKEKKD
jgi:hypothetical protein